MKMFYFYFLYSNIENALKPKGSARFLKKYMKTSQNSCFPPVKSSKVDKITSYEWTWLLFCLRKCIFNNAGA